MTYVEIELQARTQLQKITSMVRCLHHDIVDLSLIVILDGRLEQSSRLVYGFSAIVLRGMEYIGTVPSSF